jgi:hypothetical protein
MFYCKGNIITVQGSEVQGSGFEVRGALRFRLEAKKVGPCLPPTSNLYPPTAEGLASNLGTSEPLNAEP